MKFKSNIFKNWSKFLIKRTKKFDTFVSSKKDRREYSFRLILDDMFDNLHF